MTWFQPTSRKGSVRLRPVADIRPRVVVLDTMLLVERLSLIVAAALSLAASVALGALPFVSPHTPIGPFILANWLLFMLVGYFAFRPWRSGPLFSQPDRRNSNVFRVVLLGFALAGWVAVLNAEAIV